MREGREREEMVRHDAAISRKACQSTASKRPESALKPGPGCTEFSIPPGHLFKKLGTFKDSYA